eukprot:TRINITY_DN35832_c0_g2_i4.p1 TRINITY_DN35832_c0_g2~~TRINITY_DN35832_c0_g2_i4.p1  ORF type:complete len:113 (+),score=8.51 TRINITY_DN35832_c0_g2_i4:588-926(+)
MITIHNSQTSHDSLHYRSADQFSPTVYFALPLFNSYDHQKSSSSPSHLQTMKRLFLSEDNHTLMCVTEVGPKTWVAGLDNFSLFITNSVVGRGDTKDGFHCEPREGELHCSF